MTSDGLYLFTFQNVQSAREACEDWYRVHGNEAGEMDSMNDGSVSGSVCC